VNKQTAESFLDHHLNCSCKAIVRAITKEGQVTYTCTDCGYLVVEPKEQKEAA
jgi:predicted RNA-binding Zn-ribbon protein involved in translation (DUF1610 family)